MEGIQTRDCEIAGGKMYVTQLPPMPGLKLLSRLGKITTPAFAKLATLAAFTEDDIADHGDVFADAAGMLFASIDEDKVERLVLDLFATAELIRDKEKFHLGNPDHFNRAFVVDGRVDYKVMVRAIAFALSTNFADFTADVLTKIAVIFALIRRGGGTSNAETSPASPNTSAPAGQSGESG